MGATPVPGPTHIIGVVGSVGDRICPSSTLMGIRVPYMRTSDLIVFD